MTRVLDGAGYEIRTLRVETEYFIIFAVIPYAHANQLGRRVENERFIRKKIDFTGSSECQENEPERLFRRIVDLAPFNKPRDVNLIRRPGRNRFHVCPLNGQRFRKQEIVKGRIKPGK